MKYDTATAATSYYTEFFAATTQGEDIDQTGSCMIIGEMLDKSTTCGSTESRSTSRW